MTQNLYADFVAWEQISEYCWLCRISDLVIADSVELVISGSV